MVNLFVIILFVIILFCIGVKTGVETGVGAGLLVCFVGFAAFPGTVGTGLLALVVTAGPPDSDIDANDDDTVKSK